jgi:hypothetical protein
MKFFVAKVDVTKVKFEKGMAMLSPLRFHYDSEAFNLPVRLGLVNSSGKQDLIVHMLARGQRYEVANYDNVAIPTNLDVAEAARDQFGAFYAALFDKTLEKHPKSVVTEYAWDAGSCDPCPTPPLQPGDLATLGADVLAGAPATPPPSGPGKPVVPQPPISKGRPGGFMGGFVLTRLHARYSRDTLGEDLVFRAAPPLMGGREIPGEDGKLETGARPGGINNFQGRYAIRHPWTGPIACKDPHRGIWGGPPPGVTGDRGAKPALNLAFAPRGTLQLAAFVKQDVPDLGLLAPGAPATVPEMPAPTVPAPTAPAPTTAPEPLGTTHGGGCGACVAGGGTESSTAWPLAGVLGAIAAAIARRRRRD